jgi:hypothetical protein
VNEMSDNMPLNMKCEKFGSVLFEIIMSLLAVSTYSLKPFYNGPDKNK